MYNIVLSLFVFFSLTTSIRYVCVIDFADVDIEKFYNSSFHPKYIVEVLFAAPNISDITKPKDTVIYNYTECDFTQPNTTIKYKLNKDSKKSIENYLKMIDIFNIKELKFQRDWLRLMSENNETINSYALLSFLYDSYFYPDKYLEDEETENQISTITTLNSKVSWSLKNILYYILPTNYSKNNVMNVKRGDEVTSSNWIFRAYSNILEDKINDVHGKINEKFNGMEESNHTFLDDYTNSFQEWLGFYNYDMQGRKTVVFREAFLNGFVKLVNNRTFFQEAIETIENYFKGVSFTNIPVMTYFYGFYLRFTNDQKWIDIKENMGWMYSNFKYNMFSLKHFFYNMDFSIGQFDEMHIKQKNMFLQERLRRYMFTQSPSHLTKTNHLRPDDFLLHYDYLKNFDSPREHRIRKNYVTGKVERRNTNQQTTTTTTSSYSYSYDNNGYKNVKDNFLLPDYGTVTEWVIEVQDFFDLRFWNPADAWWTGYAPEDRKTIRPLAFSSAFIVPIPSLFVPADLFSFAGWHWKWFLKSNITRIILPFLDQYYEPPDETKCLPAFPYLPDPAYGCAPFYLAFLPSIIPIEKFFDFFQPFPCIEYFNPIKAIEATFQVIFSKNLGETVKNNVILNFFVGLVPLKLIPTEDLSYKTGVCLIPKIWVLIPLVILIVYVGWLVIRVLFADGFNTVTQSFAEDSTNDIETIKQEVLLQEKTQILLIEVLQALLLERKIEEGEEE